MTLAFTKATKKQARLRLALIGPSGSGKTFTALKLGTAIGKKVAVVDSERGSASKYADKFDFQALDLETFGPQEYVKAIHLAEESGFDVLIIDSLSHAWMGRGGALEQVDAAAARSKSGNSFMAWRDITPIHNELVDAMVRCKCHLIVTMRAKTEWVIEKDERGKQSPRKIGLQPVQRDGLEYEFDVVGDIDDSTLTISKTRCSALAKAVIREPGETMAKTLSAWLTDGVDAPPPKPAPPALVAAPQPSPPRVQPGPQPTSGGKLAYGPNKGKALADLTTEQALWYLAAYNKAVSEGAKKTPPTAAHELNVKWLELVGLDLVRRGLDPTTGKPKPSPPERRMMIEDVPSQGELAEAPPPDDDNQVPF